MELHGIPYAATEKLLALLAMTAGLLENGHMLAGEAAFAEMVAACRRFAAAVPASEPEQARCLQAIVAGAGDAVRSGALRLAEDFAGEARVIRLLKEPIGPGRLKLQLFPLASSEAHPPHAHYNLLSCQVLLRGRARVCEYSLLDRLPGGELRLREEPVKELEPGDGVFTLERLNNIHWQQGLEAGTVLLNINWQGFLKDSPLAGARSRYGRRLIDWDNARPAEEAGILIVPEMVEPGGP